MARKCSPGSRFRAIRVVARSADNAASKWRRGAGMRRNMTSSAVARRRDAGCKLDLSVDLAPHQEGKAAYVHPGQQDHDGAERAVGEVISVEVAQIETKAHRGYEPEEHAHQRARADPVPAPG